MSATVKPGTKSDLKNRRSLNDIWTESIFGANLSDAEIDSLYGEAEKYINEAVETYYAEHPEEDINERIYSDWNDEM